jgi:hypothetical protein
MTKIYQVYAKIYTPVGVFTGSAGDFDTEEEAFTERDNIQELLRDCDLFTIFSDEDPGTEITVNKTTIQNSVFALVVLHVDVES